MKLLHFFTVLWVVFCISDSAFANSHSKSKKKKPAHHQVIQERMDNAQVVPDNQSQYVALPTPAPAAAYGVPQLRNTLNSIINVGRNTADIAVYVKSMHDGEVLYGHQTNQPMTPASTMKILTAEAALIYLGPQYRFSTQLLTDAKLIKNGVLQGNLYIVLSGDPTLTYNDLVELMLTLRSQQINSIAGNVYIDNTAYDQRFYGPGWVNKDKNYCYAAPISASIINHNCLPLTLAPSKPGQAARVMTSSKYFYPTIRNSVVTRSSHSCSIRLSKESGSSISIDGCMPKGRYPWGISYVVADVPEYNRALFKNLLSRLSVTVYGNITFGSAPQQVLALGMHSSKLLPELIKEMLKKSDNVIAGALFKKLGQLYSHQPGSWENGSLAVSQILATQAGVNISGMRILDGSGLSPYNLATPAQMMQVLEFAYHHAPTKDHFVSSLPIAGVDGTLKHRMWNIARKVRAKTGTISGVVSLAGYTVSADNEPLAFVIMINGSKGMGWRYKGIEDKLVTALTKYRR